MRKKTPMYNQPSLFDWLDKGPEPKPEHQTTLHATIEVGIAPKREVCTSALLKQYAEMKVKHPDAILLWRVGDFYEVLAEDAEKASEILGITLTKRKTPTEEHYLAGFPHHALDTYLPKLVRAGKRVAICEQLEDPRLSKRHVKRGIPTT